MHEEGGLVASPSGTFRRRSGLVDHRDGEAPCGHVGADALEQGHPARRGALMVFDHQEAALGFPHTLSWGNPYRLSDPFRCMAPHVH